MFLVSTEFGQIDDRLIKGSKDGAVVKALASHPCGLGSVLVGCHMWVEFLQFSSHYKNQHLQIPI